MRVYFGEPLVTLLTVRSLVKDSEPAINWDGGAAPEPHPNSPAAQSSATKDLRQGGPPSPIPTSGTRQGPVSDGSGETPMHLDSHGKMLRFSSRQANFYDSQADWEPVDKRTSTIHKRIESQSTRKILQFTSGLGASRQANFYNSQADWEPADKRTFSIYLQTGSQSSSKLLNWQLTRKLGATSR